MKPYELLLLKIEDLVKSDLAFTLNKSFEIVFYGGSFNPWHKGHEACVKAISKDKVLFVLPDRNPQKELKKNLNTEDNLLTIEKRLTLIRPEHTYLFKDFYLSTLSNPTYKWLSILDKHNFKREINFSLLIGLDSFLGLHTWQNTIVLLRSVSSLYIVPREIGNDENLRLKIKNQINHLKSFNLKLNITFLDHHEFESISSTKIREMMK